MLLVNGTVCHSDFQFRQSDIRIVGENIADIASASYSRIQNEIIGLDQIDIVHDSALMDDEIIVDLAGYILVPGYIDIHVHGGGGSDTCDDSPEALIELSSHLARNGVSSFCATTMTTDEESLMAVLSRVDQFSHLKHHGARLLGVHLEGPFLSPKKSGVQSSDALRMPQLSLVNAIELKFPGMLKIIDIAPELPGADEFIQAFSDKYVLSLSHSDADYEITRQAIAQGLRHATHLYNAMRPIHHQAPGPICAILEDQSVTAELICDLIHIHPSLLALTMKCLAPDRAVIISDAMRGAGMPDGEYMLGNAYVKVYNGRTDIGDGRLAGSVSSVAEGVKNLVSLDIPTGDAIRAATINPARVLGVDQYTGSLSKGKLADVTVLNQQLVPVMTISAGRIIFDRISNSFGEKTEDRSGEDTHD